MGKLDRSQAGSTSEVAGEGHCHCLLCHMPLTAPRLTGPNTSARSCSHTAPLLGLLVSRTTVLLWVHPPVSRHNYGHLPSRFNCHSSCTLMGGFEIHACKDVHCHDSYQAAAALQVISHAPHGWISVWHGSAHLPSLLYAAEHVD
jgi:hypothetical protein